MDALILQAGLVGPLILALIVQTAGRRHQGPLQRILLWLLVLILGWMTGMVLQTSAGPGAALWAAPLLLLPTCFMAPLFCLMMLLYARVGPFEESTAARAALLAPFAMFLIGFATNPWHGLMLDAHDMVGPLEVGKAGPLFWAFQAWSNGVAFVGLGICVRIWRRDPSPIERRRVTALLFAALLPLLAHGVYTYGLLPLGFPLTPASLGVTSILLVTSMRRHRLLEVPLVARRDVIEASGDAILVANREARVVDMNPAARRLLGAARDDLRGVPLGEVLARLGSTEPPFDAQAAIEALRRGVPLVHPELETRTSAVLELRADRVRDQAGHVVGFFAVLRDRTQERRAQRLLHRTQKLESVGILAAGVAHEVNNPLAYVRANVVQLQEVARMLEEQRRMLPKDVADASEEMQEMLEDSIAGLDRMAEIVRGLLRFSRTPSGKLERCELNAIVEEAAHFAWLDRDAPVETELRLCGDLPPVEGSPERLTQVLLNLLLNAMRAVAGGAAPRIVASTHRCGEGVEVRIADNGPGVPEAIRDRIFDPFFTTRAPNEGTGLGLSIAFDIAREHRGSLELESPPEGGACFVLRLPVAAA